MHFICSTVKRTHQLMHCALVRCSALLVSIIARMTSAARAPACSATCLAPILGAAQAAATVGLCTQRALAPLRDCEQSCD